MVNSMQANEAVQWKNTGGLKQKHKKPLAFGEKPNLVGT